MLIRVPLFWWLLPIPDPDSCGLFATTKKIRLQKAVIRFLVRQRGTGERDQDER
jgi:hypothetical protein